MIGFSEGGNLCTPLRRGKVALFHCSLLQGLEPKVIIKVFTFLASSF
jgi:hypothetical protein